MQLYSQILIIFEVNLEDTRAASYAFSKEFRSVDDSFDYE